MPPIFNASLRTGALAPGVRLLRITSRLLLTVLSCTVASLASAQNHCYPGFWANRHDVSRFTMVGPAGSSIHIPASDPLCLMVDGYDLHWVSYYCDTCDDASVSVADNALPLFEWYITTPGSPAQRGTFVDIAGGAPVSDQGYQSQMILYMPPANFTSPLHVTIECDLNHSPNDVFHTPGHNGHALATAFFDITITRGEDVQTVTYPIADDPGNSATVTVRSQVNIFTVTHTQIDGVGDPQPPTTTGTCLPLHDAVPLTGIGVSITAPPSPLYTEDVLLLKASGINEDQINYRCFSTGGCTVPTGSPTYFYDPLRYTWTATNISGGTDAGIFPCGNIGKEVAYQAPARAATIRFTVIADDANSSHFNDNPRTSTAVDRTIVENRYDPSCAIIAWIDPSLQSEPPTTVSIPTPVPSLSSRRQIPHLEYAFVNYDPTATAGIPDYLDIVFDTPHLGWNFHRDEVMPLIYPEMWLPRHPWARAAFLLSISSNSSPPQSFSSMSNLDNWRQQTSREYRGIGGIQLVALERRGKFVDFLLDNNLRIVFDKGWTPETNVIASPNLRASISKMWQTVGLQKIDGYARGELKTGSRTVDVASLSTGTLLVSMSQEFRVGKAGNEIGKGLTNRNAPWIRHTLQLQLQAGVQPQSADVSFVRVPDFPSITAYFGATASAALQQSGTYSQGILSSA